LSDLGLLESDSKANGFESTNALIKVTDGFTQLTTETVKSYVAARPSLANLIGPTSGAADWTVDEVGDGNLNFVFVLRGPVGTLCIKQAPPYVRCVGESWPLTQDRVRIEAAALTEEAKHCPQHVPAIYLADGPMCLIAMEYIASPAVILRKALIRGDIFPLFPSHIATFLAETFFHTSLLALPSDAFRAQAIAFTNVEMCRLTEQVIFTDPYFAAEFNRHTSPQLDAEAVALRDDADAKAAAARLKCIFIEKQQALLHGDLHTGSIMIDQERMYVIDPEFAYVGPIAFDVAKILANLLLAFFAATGHQTTLSSREGQKSWLLDAVVAVWQAFVARFTSLWDTHGIQGAGDASSPAVFGDEVDGGAHARALRQKSFFAELWDETVGFSGAVIIRRLVGVAHVADMDEIADPDVRAACERRALRFGRRLLVEGSKTFADVRLMVKEALRSNE